MKEIISILILISLVALFMVNTIVMKKKWIKEMKK